MPSLSQSKSLFSKIGRSDSINFSSTSSDAGSSSLTAQSNSSLTAQSSSSTARSDSALKSEKSWIRRLSGGLLDIEEVADRKRVKEGELNQFVRQLKAYQISKDQLGTMPSAQTLRQDGRPDLARQLEIHGGQHELATRLGMRVRVEASRVMVK
jgi:hypothetical protein